MPVQVEYQSDTGTVVVIASGDIGLHELGCQSPAAIALIQQHSALRVLVDYTEARVDVSTLDVYKLPDEYEALGLTRHVRIAVVRPRDRNKDELFEFYADLTHNRGFTTRLFGSPAEAMRWLESADPTG